VALGAVAQNAKSVCGSNKKVGSFVADGYCAFLYAKVPGARGITKDSKGNVLVVSNEKGAVYMLKRVDKKLRKFQVTNALDLTHGILLDESARAKKSGGPWLYASTPTTVYRFKYVPGRQKRMSPKVVVSGIPDFGHLTRSLAMDKKGRLYVQVGSLLNVDRDLSRTKVKRFEAGQLNRKLSWTKHGEDWAVGLRNTVGLRFDVSGTLWGVENGADELERSDIGGDVHNDNPCEELNKLNKKGKMYGYPYCFSEYRLPKKYSRGKRSQWAWPSKWRGVDVDDKFCRNRAKVTPPKYCMPAHWAPLGCEFQPKQGAGVKYPFPQDRAGDLIVMSHGSWNRDPPTGHVVARIKFNKPGGEPLQQEPEILYSDLARRHVRPVDGIFLNDGTFLFTADDPGEVLALRYMRNGKPSAKAAKQSGKKPSSKNK